MTSKVIKSFPRVVGAIKQLRKQVLDEAMNDAYRIIDDFKQFKTRLSNDCKSKEGKFKKCSNLGLYFDKIGNFIKASGLSFSAINPDRNLKNIQEWEFKAETFDEDFDRVMQAREDYVKAQIELDIKNERIEQIRTVLKSHKNHLDVNKLEASLAELEVKVFDLNEEMHAATEELEATLNKIYNDLYRALEERQIRFRKWYTQYHVLLKEIETSVHEAILAEDQAKKLAEATKLLERIQGN